MPFNLKKLIRKKRDPEAEFLRSIADWQAALAHSPLPVIFEGLPHQLFEEPLFASELKRKVHVPIHGYPFYKAVIAPPDEVTAALTEAARDADTFAPFAGEKRCGGFHPDWAIEWRDNKSACHLLLCSGCGEAKLFWPGGTSRVDQGNNNFRRFFEILAPLGVNRPREA